MVRIAAACALVLIWLVEPAAAATVTGTRSGVAVRVTDEDGERNRLEVVVRRGVLIEEHGRAELRAGGVCRLVAPRRVRCPQHFSEVRVFAGAGDDRVVRAGGLRVTFRGGPGRDRLLAGNGNAELVGGPGDDVLRAGRRPQYLSGGAGEDRLSGGRGGDFLIGGAGADVVAGGLDRDFASWAGSRRPVRVDLGRQTATGDRIRGIEGAAGGSRDDTLIGTAGPDRLEGGGGRDVLAGGGGNDRIDVGRREGNFLASAPGAPDTVRCGPGDDIVDGAGRGSSGPRRPEALGPDCERLAMADDWANLFGEILRVQPLRVVRGRVRVRVACSLEYLSCPRRVTLRAGGRVLGRSRTVRVPPEVGSVSVRLRRALPAGSVLVHTRGPSYRFLYRLRLPEPSF